MIEGEREKIFYFLRSLSLILPLFSKEPFFRDAEKRLRNVIQILIRG